MIQASGPAATNEKPDRLSRLNRGACSPCKDREVVMQPGFSLETLSQFSTFDVRSRYCDDYLDFISGASDSGRRIYDLGNNQILKLAIGQKGISKNTTESDYALHRLFQPIVNSVHQCDHNDLWLIADKTSKPSLERLIEGLGGVSMDELASLTRRFDAYQLSQATHFNYTDKDKALFKKSPLLEKAFEMADDFSLLTGKWTKPNAWGEKEGGLVLTRFGINVSVHRQFYAASRKHKTSDHDKMDL